MRDIEKGGGHMKTEAEIRVIHSQAEGCLEPPEAGGDREDPPLQPLGETWPCLWDFKPLGL
jgi:hypothetical protein